MKIIFFGSSSFSLPILESLIQSKHQVSLVLTVPAKKRGRGQELRETPVEAFAKEKGVTVIAPPNLKDADLAKRIQAENANCFVVASYGKMIPDQILSLCKFPLNIHPSLLPKYRGASPIISQLLDGIHESGVSIAKITSKLDAGDLCAQSKVILLDTDDAVSAEEKLTQASSTLLLKTLELIESGKCYFSPQDNQLSTYAAKLTKESGKVDWTKSASHIHNQIRALLCWPTAYTFWNGKRIKLLKSTTQNRSQTANASSVGKILSLNKSGSAEISCGEGILEINLLQPESGKAMTPYQFCIGHQLKVGDCLE